MVSARICIQQNSRGAYLRKITGTSQVQDVHVLVDVLAVEPPENEYPTVSQKRHMISSS